MEKILSPDERIRRAEEIYYRRQLQNSRRETATVNVSDNDRNNYGLFSKMLIQIIVCVIIYTAFYVIQNVDHVFSNGFIEKTRQILEYDINIQKLYEQASSYINNLVSNSKENSEQVLKQNIIEENNEVTQEIVEETNVVSEMEILPLEENNLSQMELDVKDILERFTFVKPVIGVVTSAFGERESTNPMITPYHTGIDIGADEGTSIIAAIGGNVETVSEIGDYR